MTTATAISTADEGAAAATPRRSWYRSPSGRLGLVTGAGLAGTLLISSSAPVWHKAAPSWRLTIPGIPHPGPPVVAFLLFLLGAGLLSAAWIGLVTISRDASRPERSRIRMVVAMLILWSVPLLVGPPLLSNDVYSYAAQGELASQGVDPTSTGPTALERGEFLRAADPIWRRAPAPYGPVAIASSQAVVSATGHNAANAVWGFRVLMLVGITLAAVGIPVIARSYGADPALALALGLVNPLVLLHFVGGIHNDALMLGLLICGIAAARRDKRVLAVMLIALATAVKLPAACGFVFLGWDWVGPRQSTMRRLVGAGVVSAIGMTLVAAMSALVGIGFGWITALSNTGKVTSTLAPATLLGLISGDMVRSVGVELSASTVVSLFRLAGLAVAGFVCFQILLRSDRFGMVRALGLAMLVVIAFGPVIWPWYLPVGLALLAAGGVGRFRPAFTVVVVASSFLVWPTSVGLLSDLTTYRDVLGLVVVVLITGAAYFAQHFAAARGDDTELLEPAPAAARIEKRREPVSA
ncbi:MAG: polyprenol phosphomannose-dependent alpha 1,6 mannosyltransferase MptB [Acidimicrobiia bacterium]|nr:polyprenol phosphomannose-dependent alpha 1,6 mannosyltransferase MptB [Acidimicrobiia bacterium]